MDTKYYPCGTLLYDPCEDCWYVHNVGEEDIDNNYRIDFPANSIWLVVGQTGGIYLLYNQAHDVEGKFPEHTVHGRMKKMNPGSLYD